MDKKYVDFGTTQSKIESLLFYENACGEDFNLGYDKAIFDVLGILADMPTADVQEVRHGRWKCCYVKDAFQCAYHCVNVCSKCGRESLVKENFCPNCGARMDEKDGVKNA